MSDLTVIFDSLRDKAKLWDAESSRIGSIAVVCKGMELCTISAGVFQAIVSPYDGVTATVATRCLQGQQGMQNIATALNDSAQKYESAEQASTTLAMSARLPETQP